ncbi:hypothetical protein [Citrobacter sp. VF227]
MIVKKVELDEIGYNNINVAIRFLNLIMSKEFIKLQNEDDFSSGFSGMEIKKLMTTYILGFAQNEQEKNKHINMICKVIDEKSNL